MHFNKTKGGLKTQFTVGKKDSIFLSVMNINLIHEKKTPHRSHTLPKIEEKRRVYSFAFCNEVATSVFSTGLTI